MIRVERYAETHQSVWDAFVAGSKNGTFLFQRDYMDYHKDRFSDHSLMIYDDQRLIALLPANCDTEGTTLVSHDGLTYGGLISDAHMKTPLMLALFAALLTFCREQGFTSLRYKAMPHIYQRIPAQEDLHALTLCGAQLHNRSVMTVIGQERPPLPKGRRYSVSKARKYGLEVRRADEDLPAYWALLEASLSKRHQAQPVHTLAEIQTLRRRFPQQIQLHACYDKAQLIAGVLIFESANVARTQYIAVSERGRERCALDLILDDLLNQVFANKPYFDFGTSHEPATGALKSGLIEQKESFGGRAVAQDTYWIDLERWNPELIRGAVR
ncbi:MAG TPA: GNAT family N-acetyltransferase [Phototrophicaceae bacterium]|nr:GNAT family N-acetyltransferase [Phototrophicaceae bacterium]